MECTTVFRWGATNQITDCGGIEQDARFKESRIRSAVFGNSRQFFLMRQNDRADLRGGGGKWGGWHAGQETRSEYAPLSPASFRRGARELSRNPRGCA